MLLAEIPLHALKPPADQILSLVDSTRLRENGFRVALNAEAFLGHFLMKYLTEQARLIAEIAFSIGI